jgi:hypothetical protein
MVSKAAKVTPITKTDRSAALTTPFARSFLVRPLAYAVFQIVKIARWAATAAMDSIALPVFAQLRESALNQVKIAPRAAAVAHSRAVMTSAATLPMLTWAARVTASAAMLLPFVRLIICAVFQKTKFARAATAALDSIAWVVFAQMRQSALE